MYEQQSNASPLRSAAVPFWFMRAKEVMAAVGISKSTLYAWVATGRFPRPVQLPGGGATAWVSSEVAAWMAAAVAARDSTQSIAA